MSVFKKYLAEEQVPCPKCRESISQQASICPHCKSNLEEDESWLAAQSPENTGAGCSAILLFSLTGIVSLTKVVGWLAA